MVTLQTRDETRPPAETLNVNLPDGLTRRMSAEAARYLEGLRNENGNFTGIVSFACSNGAKDTPSVMLPQLALDLIAKLLAELGQGRAVTVETLEADLTPDQVAQILHVSLPVLRDLLDKGEIPFREENGQRLISLTELIAFKRRDDDFRDEMATELTREAQRIGLEY